MHKKRERKNKKRNNGGGGPNGSFKGFIRVLERGIPWKRNGRMKPRTGAELTVRQALSGLSMATHTGMTGGTNHYDMVNTGGYGLVINHALNDLPQASSWTSVFDQYRFEEVEVHFYPYVNTSSTTNTATNIANCSDIVLDFDDATALGSENAALEYDTVQTFSHYDHVVVRYKPAVSPAYYSSGAFTGYGVAPDDKAWLDCASASILHYGIKGWIGGLVATSTMVAGWNVYAQYTVSFRNVR